MVNYFPFSCMHRQSPYEVNYYAFISILLTFSILILGNQMRFILLLFFTVVITVRTCHKFQHSLHLNSLVFSRGFMSILSLFRKCCNSISTYGAQFCVNSNARWHIVGAFLEDYYLGMMQTINFEGRSQVWWSQQV